MGNRIPEDVVERIRQSVDIVDVIGDYVQLKKQGRNYFGLCPFHGENTPSFSVSSDKQIFHCFGCGEGGNALSFVMKVENISFTEAVMKLGNRSGIQVAEYVSEPEETTDHNSEMIQAHELLKKYYHHLLMNTQDAKPALEYLLNRGISKEMITKFEIGYAGVAWDHATRVLQKRGFAMEQMVQAGLVMENEKDGSYYDRFRNRVMFPIYSLQGKTIAFSGRALGEDSPKYMNSPETPIFHKSNTLYHFHQARSMIRKTQRVLLMEGYADVIAAVHCGLEEAVATMGTAITEEQARILRRNVDTVVLCYDGDKAGQEATVKAGHLLLHAGCQVRVVIVPDKMDPDEFVRKHGVDSFRNLIEESIPFVDFKLYYLRLGKNLQDPEEQGAYVQAVVKELARLTTFVQAQPYLQTLTKEFPYEMEDLRSELRKYQNQQQPTRTIPEQKQNIGIKTKLAGYERSERELLYHALQSREVAQRLQDFVHYFHTEEHKGILYEVYAYYEKGNEPNISKFMDWLSQSDLKNIVADISVDVFINPTYSLELFDGDIKSLQKHKEKLDQMRNIFELRKLEKVDPKAAAVFAQENIIKQHKARK
ncbi:DNA primase [Ectobacillus sp. sgz5001026]|uniref:DNA primase n=1 Tax=Ectobacillus sp. sgz5001026 TaxID=3242473 RepID=UPI0036D2FC33